MQGFDDVLGGEPVAPPQRRGPGRPTNAEREARAAARAHDLTLQAEIRAAGMGRTKISEDEFLLPVSQNFLARVLRMDPMTVKARLRGCKPAGTVGSGRPVFLFHEALPYLVKPKMDIGTYLKTLNPTDLPNSINKTFWEAERIKNKALIETGQAWTDGDVLDVLGSVFMMFKDRLPLIVEGLREAGASDDALGRLTSNVELLQRDLHAALVEMPAKRRTLPRSALIDPSDGPAPEWSDDAIAEDVLG